MDRLNDICYVGRQRKCLLGIPAVVPRKSKHTPQRSVRTRLRNLAEHFALKCTVSSNCIAHLEFFGPPGACLFLHSNKQKLGTQAFFLLKQHAVDQKHFQFMLVVDIQCNRSMYVDISAQNTVQTSSAHVLSTQTQHTVNQLS